MLKSHLTKRLLNISRYRQSCCVRFVLMGHVNEMWRNRVVLLTLTLTLTLFSSYSYFIHSYDRLRHIILILAVLTNWQYMLTGEDR